MGSTTAVVSYASPLGLLSIFYYESSTSEPQLPRHQSAAACPPREHAAHPVRLCGGQKVQGVLYPFKQSGSVSGNFVWQLIRKSAWVLS